MISIPHKTKQFLVLLIKVLIVAGAFYFIYNQLANNDKLEAQFITKFKKINQVGNCLYYFKCIESYFEILNGKI
jgi:hypothetical protein